MHKVSHWDTYDSMQLESYLSKHNISIPQFATMIDASNRAVVWRYLNGIRRPSDEMLERIKRVTHGHVTANDFIHKSN